MSEPRLFGDSSLPEPLDTRVRSELGEGEQLLWVGQPNPGRQARAAIPLVLFGIPWTAFALFWTAVSSGILLGGFGGPDGGPGMFLAFFACFPLCGLPFVVIGLGLLSSPYWLWRRAKKVCYALTDRRAITWEPRWFGGVAVRSYGPSQLTKIRRTEYPDGSGDLVFEEIITYGRDSDGYTTTSRQRNGFLSIANVREVEELLRKALRPDGSG
jgi:hypothetical protein